MEVKKKGLFFKCDKSDISDNYLLNFSIYNCNFFIAQKSKRIKFSFYTEIKFDFIYM